MLSRHLLSKGVQNDYNYINPVFNARVWNRLLMYGKGERRAG